MAFIAAAKRGRSDEKMAGLLNNIRYVKDSFIIADFLDWIGDSFSGLGNIINPQIGAEYELSGTWTVDPRFGKQFKFSKYSKLEPQTEQGLLAYLDKTPWVGRTIGKKIIAAYGIQTLEKLKSDPETVAQDIKGITIERAKDIQKYLLDNELIEKTLVALEDIFAGKRLPKALPTLIVEKWGTEAVDIIRANPYRLTEFHGVGFLSADRVAMGLEGFDPDSVFRQAAAVRHLLAETINGKGHTWVAGSDIDQGAIDLVSRPVTDGIEMMVDTGEVAMDDKLLSLGSVAEDEAYVAQKINRFLYGGVAE
ncbi:MAG: hypothetical protein HQK59_01770 [Deltaproteobacteria bacterium]|nr:hypothetical protein [Deltaproteobacteria bacterium]